MARLKQMSAYKSNTCAKFQAAIEKNAVFADYAVCAGYEEWQLISLDYLKKAHFRYSWATASTLIITD
jgi:hypothetical protein